MGESISSLFKVSVDFDTSHLIFPRIIIALLVIIFVVIACTHWRQWLARLRAPEGISFLEANADLFRLISTLVLLPVYFVAMSYLSDQFPNMGYGFLFASVPFIFVLSLIYVHGLTRRVLMLISINAIVAPLFVWYMLGQVFGITLP